MTRFHFSTEALAASVGDIFFVHYGTDHHGTAYEVGDRSIIRLNLPRSLGVSRAEICPLGDEAHCLPDSALGIWRGVKSIFDVYEFDFGILRNVGIAFFCFKLTTVLGDIYGCFDGGRVAFTDKLDNARPFQISVSDFKYRAPLDLAGGVIYHVFVDRFARGGNVPLKNGAVLVDDWQDGVPEYPEYPGAPLKNNTFYGGTLYGVIDKLDYIASLGVNIIYLSPIFDAASNHKYDTGNYMSVDPMFGADIALEKLISEAEKRGIKIILDGVFNHTGDDSIYFNRYGKYDSIGAAQSPDSPFFSWYDFQSYPDKYTCWWGVDILPRINPDTPSCAEYFVGNGGVIEKYAKMGIAGFRLDVVDELSDEFVSKIKHKLNEHNPDSILYGEVWEDASNKVAYGVRKSYYLGAELDGVMNYPLRTGIINYIKYKDVDSLRYALTEVINNAPERIRNIQMNFLGTHDTERILTVLGDDYQGGLSNSELRVRRMNTTERSLAIKKLKAAYTVLATLPGIPSVFYGDEAGLEGYHDPFNRMPYPWDDANDELIAHYSKVGILRRKNEVYSGGSFKLLYLDSNLLAFARYDLKSAYITVYNNSDEAIKLDMPRTSKIVIGDPSGVIVPYSSVVFLAPIGSTLSIN